MRFGPRTIRREATERTAARQPQAATGGSASRRLQRMADHFRAQAELLDQMRTQVEQEIAPLSELMVRQRQTMRRVLANLDQRLHPLNEYTDSEETNLSELDQRLGAEPSEFVRRSFGDYLAQQRQCIAETRSRIDEQRRPFLRFGDEQHETLELSLARFDSDVE